MSKRETIEPTITPDGRGGTKESHPAFGALSVFQTSGYQPMFGSDFRHHHYISFELSEADLHRDLSHDHHYSKKTIVRFRMSYAQFAMLAGQVGTHAGIPVTLEYRPDPDAEIVTVPDFPQRDENELFAVEGSAALDEALAALSDLEAKVRDAASGLPKGKAAKLLGDVQHARAKLNSTLPFIEKSFRERMEERVQKAKTEIASWTSATLARLGLQSTAIEAPLIESDQEVSP